jgi:D-xylose 1-dehydrogenase
VISQSAYARYTSLQDRVVFITGGGSGIGAAMVEAFAAQGAKVAFVDILEDQSLALCDRVAATAQRPLFLNFDILNIPALQSAISIAREKLGTISVLVNNAAVDQRHKTDDLTPDAFDKAMGLNLKHQYFAAQAVRAQMASRGGGSIINFSSIAFMFGVGDMAAYAIAKSAVIGLTTSLARDYGGDNIRVNAIAPGAVVTERQRKLWLSEADIESFKARQCLHRTLLADEIARLALFLAADDSAMITKQCLIIDAGLH